MIKMQKNLNEYNIEIIIKKEAKAKNRDDLSVAEFMAQKKRLEQLEKEKTIRWENRRKKR